MLNYHICRTCQRETLWSFDTCWEWDTIMCQHGFEWLKETDDPPTNCPYLLEQTLIRKKHLGEYDYESHGNNSKCI